MNRPTDMGQTARRIPDDFGKIPVDRRGRIKMVPASRRAAKRTLKTQSKVLAALARAGKG